MIYIKEQLVRLLKLWRFSRAKHPFVKKPSHRRLVSRLPSHIRNIAGALWNIGNIPDYQFKRIIRLDKEAFADLSSKISPLLQKNLDMGVRNGTEGIISSKIMLLATLRYLAGGMKWDTCLSLHIGFGSFWGERGVIWPTMYAIDSLDEYEIGSIHIYIYIYIYIYTTYLIIV
jgi:hypothetical protein